MKKIAVDFDRTLAEYDGNFFTPIMDLKPITKMVKKVQKWLAKGYTIIIFTARVNDDYNGEIATQISNWCELNLGQRLAVTNMKTYDIDMFVDDKALPVKENTGKFGLSKKVKNLK